MKSTPELAVPESPGDGEHLEVPGLKGLEGISKLALNTEIVRATDGGETPFGADLTDTYTPIEMGKRTASGSRRTEGGKDDPPSDFHPDGPGP